MLKLLIGGPHAGVWGAPGQQCLCATQPCRNSGCYGSCVFKKCFPQIVLLTAIDALPREGGSWVEKAWALDTSLPLTAEWRQCSLMISATCKDSWQTASAWQPLLTATLLVREGQSPTLRLFSDTQEAQEHRS